MRILVHEFATGGGFAGCERLAREGTAMLTALLADLVSSGAHHIVTTADARLRRFAPRHVEVATLDGPPRRRTAQLDRLIADAEAVWMIAPETERHLERLAARVERQRKLLIGSSAAAIRAASDKGTLPRLLTSRGIVVPRTLSIAPGAPLATWMTTARNIGFPIVVKPRRGAGCHDVHLVRDAQQLRRTIANGRRSQPMLLQQFVRGVPASVSLVADGQQHAVALAVNGQTIRGSVPFSYRGGETPLRHPQAARAADVAVAACEAIPGLRGYVGVDMVLSESDAAIIEINPRLTTAYVGLRRAMAENIAALIVDACAGTLPDPPHPCRRVRFTAAGRVSVAGR
jgi:predicted ATP-grasp superfamily ATP-dependent carboligase